MAPHLSAVLVDSEKWDVVRALWNEDVQSARLELYESYFRYYHEELDRANNWFNASKTTRELAIDTHQDIRSVAEFLFNNRSTGRRELRSKLGSEHFVGTTSESALQNSIELVLRLCLMLNIREVNSAVQTRARAIEWHDDELSLNDFVAQRFSRVEPTAITDTRLPALFNVPHMHKACGLTIEWTECLADHLKVNQSRRKVRIFHLKQCLIDHMHGGGSIVRKNPILPPDMVRQAIWTLNLLFPLETDATDKFLSDYPNVALYTQGVDPDERPRNLREYSYWYRRLQDLLEVYERGPTTVSQYYTYLKSYEKLNWVIAVFFGFFLATVFGVISSVAAILSYQKTAQALEVAQLAYQLQQQDWARQQLSPICPCS